MINKFFLLSCSLFLCGYAAHAQHNITIPLGGNAFVVQGTENGARITDKGLTNWTSPNTVTSLYFSVSKPQQASVSLIVDAAAGNDYSIKLHNKTYTVHTAKNGEDTLKIAAVHFDTGYVRIDIRGKQKQNDDFGKVQSLLLEGDDIAQNTVYVKDKKNFYFGRRGPSVHWGFAVPEAAGPVEYFYNEIYVPKGNDVLGSYFEADGFSAGYFGMQVNSPTERHVLFSVWSPYSTNNPDEIPDNQKIILVKKGAGVHGGEFGSEGSGGQSYLNYPWKTDTHYAFLLKAMPDPADSTTTFTAYFKEANASEWLLIASFKRPKTVTYLKGLYSFLENFSPGMGNITRGAYYCNQWVCDTSGKWYPVQSARFTTDHKVQGEERHDYTGNASAKGYYLQNAGFFNGNGSTIANTFFGNRYSNMQPPKIDFETLP